MAIRRSIQNAALVLVLVAPGVLPLAHARDGVRLVAEPSSGMPTCEEFFDKWEVPGAPSGILAMAGFGREVFAAKDCIDKGNVPMACKHWQGLLVVIDKMGPPLDENRGDIVTLMDEHDCDANVPVPQPDPEPSSDLPSEDAHSE
jgi:hypothetical protein